MYLFYYHPDCPYSKDLSSAMAQHGILQQFRTVQASNGMTVPMLVVDGRKFVGRDAFTWLRQAISPTGPQCYDLNDCAGVEFSDLEDGGHGKTFRSQRYCQINDSDTSMASAASTPQAQVMDPRVSKLILARQQQLPGPVQRL